MISIAFIATIIKNQGASNNFQPQGARHLKLYVEMETRKLIQVAVKYMTHDKRTVLSAKDIQMASEHLNHTNLLPLTLQTPKRNLSPKQMHISQLPSLCEYYFANKSIGETHLKGHYLLNDGRMNPQPHKTVIRRLRQSQIMDNCQKRKELGHFNVIIDQPEQLLTAEESHYLCSYQSKLQKNKPKEILQFQGNPNKLFPLCVQLLTRYCNEASIKLLYLLVTHTKLDSNILLFYLDKIMEVLLAYQGAWSFKVGSIIGFLVHRFRDNQPQLLNVMQIASDSYSSLIKIIAFQEVLGLSPDIYHTEDVIAKAIKDSLNGDKVAALYVKTLLDKEETIPQLIHSQVYLPFWIPQPLLQNDPYLHNL